MVKIIRIYDCGECLYFREYPQYTSSYGICINPCSPKAQIDTEKSIPNWCPLTDYEEHFPSEEFAKLAHRVINKRRRMA